MFSIACDTKVDSLQIHALSEKHGPTIHVHALPCMVFQLQLSMEGNPLHLYTLRIDTSQTTLHSN